MRAPATISHNLKTDGKILILAVLMMAALATSPAQAEIPARDSDIAAEGNNAFAAALYQQLGQKPGNLFFSPQSISSVLAMAYAGAAGDTAAELKAVLHDDLGSAKLQPALGALLRDFNAGGAAGGYKLDVASALWVEKSYALKDDYKKIIADSYGAAPDAVNFAGAPDEARKTINAWALDHTGQKIKDLLPEGSVSSATRLILSSAIYFAGDWETVFDHEDTSDAAFTVAPDKKPLVPMMSHKFGGCGAKYWQDDNMQALSLPYKGGRLSMLVLLPDAKTSLADVEKALTPEKLIGWLAHKTDCPDVMVHLPKFTMDYSADVLAALKPMGLAKAAEAGAADFSGISGNKDLFVSGVFHKAFVHVDEEGTVAAAATAMAMAGSAAPMAPPVEFNADHPFIFVIRDDKSGAVLFMGRVADPS